MLKPFDATKQKNWRLSLDETFFFSFQQNLNSIDKKSQTKISFRRFDHSFRNFFSRALETFLSLSLLHTRSIPLTHSLSHSLFLCLSLFLSISLSHTWAFSSSPILFWNAFLKIWNNLTVSPQLWLSEAELSRLGKKGLKREWEYTNECEIEREREQPVHYKQMMFCSTAAKVGGGRQQQQQPNFSFFLFLVEQMKQKEEEKETFFQSLSQEKTDH